MQEPRRWTNQSQPQTLQIAVFLLYANAVISSFYMLLGADPLFVLPTAVGGAAAGYGIANEKKWGYLLGLAAASVPFVFILLGSSINPIGLMFDIALLALLLHTQSREYQRIWFK